MQSVTVRAPGKVNLQLAVGGAREDGYHELVTVFHAVSLHDDVTVRDAPAGSGISVEVVGRWADKVPTDMTNLAAKAVAALARMAEIDGSARIRIDKGIPVAGGMAGGSADAAAALVAADRLWSLGLTKEDLDDVAASLGSDVPFALHGGTAMGTGRGEVITPILAVGEYHWVFALADEGLSTPAVYGAFDRLSAGRFLVDPAASQRLLQALRRGDAPGVGAAMTNDLQSAAISLRPGIERLISLGEEYEALGSIVSGSGPTCAFLVADEDAALDMCSVLEASGECSGVVRASGPAHGARIIEG